jgi:hypothetical protein
VHTSAGSRLKNASSSPLCLKYRCIRWSIPTRNAEPSRYPYGAHSGRSLTSSVKAALRHNRHSQNHAVPHPSSTWRHSRQHYGATVGTNNQQRSESPTHGLEHEPDLRNRFARPSGQCDSKPRQRQPRCEDGHPDRGCAGFDE